MITKQKFKQLIARHYIDGEYVELKMEKSFENINPATEEVLGIVAEGGKEEVDAAVAAARKAFNGPWKKMTLEERSKILRRIGDLILERQEELARLESLDTGKPFSLANSVDIPRAAYNFHFFADYDHFCRNRSLSARRQSVHYAIRRPVGVVGIIKPWNLPLLLFNLEVGSMSRYGEYGSH